MRQCGLSWGLPRGKLGGFPDGKKFLWGFSLSEGLADCLPRGKPFGVSVGANPFIPLARRLPEGVQGANGKPPAGMTRDNFAEEIPLWRGLTRRLRRGLGLAVPRGAHTFLSVAKEKCAKESQRHGDYGKKASTAHFDGGARNVARNGVR